MCAKKAVHQSPVVLAKREAVKKRIVKSVTPLFLEKGFDKTTIKDIEVVTGLKAGSIYNLFENKSDILRESSILLYSNIIDESRKKLDSHSKPLCSAAYPFVLELYAAANSPIIASLMNDGRANEDILKNLTELRTDMVREYLAKNEIRLETATINTGLIGLSGAMVNYISSYNSKPRKECRMESIAMMTIFCALFGNRDSAKDIESAVDHVLGQLKSEGMNIISRMALSMNGSPS